MQAGIFLKIQGIQSVGLRIINSCVQAVRKIFGRLDFAKFDSFLTNL